MKRTLLVVTSAFVTATGACVPVVHDVPTQRVMQKSYAVDEVQRAAVGDAMVSIEDFDTRPVYEAATSFTTPSIGTGGSQKHLSEGERFVAVFSTPDGNEIWLAPEGEEVSQFTPMISIRPDGTVLRGWVIPGTDINDNGAWLAVPIFRESDQPAVVESAFRAELLYVGTSGNTLRLTYREFSENFARPAFTQGLEYDLSRSDTITFKSLRIRVIDAGNDAIRYQVLEDGGLPWWPGR